MAYKVLGQVTTVAPSTASTILNYIKDPSFSAVPITSAISVSTNSVYRGLTGSPWGFYTSNGGNNFRFTSLAAGNAPFAGVTAPFGGTTTAYGGWNQGQTSGYVYLTQGINSGRDIQNVTPTTDWPDSSTSIPVTPGTTYYAGWSNWKDGPYLDYTVFRVWWYNGNTYLSANEVNGNNGTGSWVRSTGTFTAPANATQALIAVYGYTNGGGNWVWDGIVFGTDSTYASTFVEPSFGLGAILSPYDKKQYGFDTNSTSAITRNIPAGALQTLYTVPAGKRAVVSTLTMNNAYAGASTYRVVVQPSGESLAPKHFVCTDTPIGSNQTQTITIGMTLAAGDVVKVASDTSALSASLFGDESNV